MTVIAAIATSSVNERQSIVAQVGLGVWLQVLMIPLVLAWTQGGGFLNQLYLKDEGGCIAIHLVIGLAGLIMSSFIGTRLGRFEQLPSTFDSDDSDQEDITLLSKDS